MTILSETKNLEAKQVLPYGSDFLGTVAPKRAHHVRYSETVGADDR